MGMKKSFCVTILLNLREPVILQMNLNTGKNLGDPQCSTDYTVLNIGAGGYKRPGCDLLRDLSRQRQSARFASSGKGRVIVSVF
jgi:hypothetical protein